MSSIVDKLARLRAIDGEFKLFGANSHHYELNPTLSEHEVRQLEGKYSFMLPKDYRWFITSIGNGGAGPFYGLFPLGMSDYGLELASWEKGGLIGNPALPFQHSEAWNLPPEFWAEEPDPGEEVSVEKEDELWAAWDKKLEAEYWNPRVMHGAIPICHEGCALRDWLIVAGPLTGNIWRDMRIDSAGIAPIRKDDGTPMSFLDWYCNWLDTQLGAQTSANASQETLF